MYVVYEIASGRVKSSHSKQPTADSGYAVVFRQDYNPIEDVYYNPELGSFTGMSDAEQNAIEMQSLRSQRDKLLAQSDWTQVADAPVDAAAWATYRQALRDLPANTTDPRNPTWPTKPT